MFKTKKFPTEISPTGFSSKTTLPNNDSQIRTLKDDLAQLKSGKKEVSGEPIPQAPVSQPPVPQPVEAPPISLPKTVPAPSFLEQKVPLSSLNQTQKEKPAEIRLVDPKNSAPGPFGSETFFKTHSPFDEKVGDSAKGPANLPKKSSHKIIIILSFLLILSLLGGGAYYWWFFIKSSQKSSAPAKSDTASSRTGTNNNSSLKQLALDLKADKIANKLAIERYVKNIVAADSQGKAAEVKLASSDNSLVTPQTFSEVFDFVFPASVAEKITNEYSLFVFFENSEPRLGAAFKLSQSGNLAESLKSEEKDLFLGLKSFYLDKSPANPQTTFNSSQYKNADIRYLNFSSPANTSLDYTVLSDKENSYFIFSTSKNSLRAILDYMSEK